MDQHKLRSLVFEKTGVRVDIDDPIFALVALNEAVLAEAVERHVALIDAASQELVRHARNAGGVGGVGVGTAAPHSDGASRTGAYIDATNEPVLAEAAARAARNGSAPMASDAASGETAPAPLIGAASGASHAPTPAMPMHTIAAQAAPLTPREWRLLGAAAGVAILSALLVLAGQALFFKPKPAPAPIVQLQAKTLTPEQSAAIANSEKLTRVMQRIDPKTRALIQTELQKP